MKQTDKIHKYLGENKEVLFTLFDVSSRYYYKLERSTKWEAITYKCFDGDRQFYEHTIHHIDDAYAWFLLRNEEKVIERLYKKAHSMAQKALINADANGC